MTFNEKILSYDMTERDKLLAEIAQVIVGAYNGSYKPHLIPKEKEVGPPYYRWKHGSEGYSLISSETQDFEHSQVLVTDERITDFIEHVFLVLAGNASVKWKNVCKSDAVNRALAKHFEMPDITFLRTEISNIGYKQYFNNLGNAVSNPTIWITVDMNKSKDVWNVMELKGFTYLDRNLWYLELDSQLLPKMADAEKITEYKSHGMSFKSGQGNQSNSSKWYCAYDHVTGEYTAAISFSSAAQGSLSLYIISKAVWDAVGNFEDDDYKSEKLIESGGVLALEREYYNRNGYELPDQIYDNDYEARFAWYFNNKD